MIKHEDLKNASAHASSRLNNNLRDVNKLNGMQDHVRDMAGCGFIDESAAQQSLSRITKELNNLMNIRNKLIEAQKNAKRDLHQYERSILMEQRAKNQERVDKIKNRLSKTDRDFLTNNYTLFA